MKTRNVIVVATIMAILVGVLGVLGGLEEGSQQPKTGEHVTYSPLQP